MKGYVKWKILDIEGNVKDEGEGWNTIQTAGLQKLCTMALNDDMPTSTATFNAVNFKDGSGNSIENVTATPSAQLDANNNPQYKIVAKHTCSNANGETIVTLELNATSDNTILSTYSINSGNGQALNNGDSLQVTWLVTFSIS